MFSSSASSDSGYNISRSVRLRSSASAYFNRTLTTPTSNTTWTFSCWLKRGAIGSTGGLFAESTGYAGIYFSSDKIRVMDNAGGVALETTAVYRDPSAWAHLIIRSNGTNIKAYWNSVEVGSYTGTITLLNAATSHHLGRYSSAYFDGYLTEVNFIDGQALTPSSFGENDSITGVWKPKKYTGTYGINGFYLNFSDNSNNTAATIGKDYSGNGNNWTPNNISLTAGVTYDSMIDTPTPYADGENGRGNYCTLSPLQIGPYAALSAGNLRVTGNSGTNSAVSLGTFSPTSGKWYWEVTQGTTVSEFIGVMTKTVTGESLIDGSALAQTLGKGVVARYNGNVRGIAGELQSVSAFTWTTGDIIQFAVDLDNGAVYFGKNGTWLNSGVPTSGSSKTGSFLNFTQDGTRCCTPACDAYNGGYVDANFGQRPFTNTPPTGFKALNTQNLLDSTIKKGSTSFDVQTWSGDNVNGRTITSTVDVVDFAWVKKRNGIDDHRLANSVLGGNKHLKSNASDTESTGTTVIQAFSGNTFTVGNDNSVNASGGTYVGWLWKKGATPGFDIVTYTGNYNGSTGTQTIAHSLGVAPKMIIVKNRSSAYDWGVGHASIGFSQAALLNGTNAFGASAYFNSTAPTSSVFSVGLSNISNQNLSTHVAYLFAEVAGYSTFGSYTGNGSTDGPFVYLGFRPRFVMVKSSSFSNTETNWVVWDSSRTSYNGLGAQLFANQSYIEGQRDDNASALAEPIDFLSNGFKIRSSFWSNNGGAYTYIYAAFAENPFKYSLAR